MSAIAQALQAAHDARPAADAELGVTVFFGDLGVSMNTRDDVIAVFGYLQSGLKISHMEFDNWSDENYFAIKAEEILGIQGS